MQPNSPGSYGPVQPNIPSYNSGSSKKGSNLLVILLVIVCLLLIGAIAFGVWAFGERSTYKNESDKIVASEVEKAKQDVSKTKEAEFAEKEKSPNQEYKGPDAFGSVQVLYPKTWSAFVTETDKSSTPVDGYFHPNYVPGIQSGTAIALRLKVVDSAYATELKKFDSLVKSNKVKVSAIVAEKVPSVTGARIDGEIVTGKQGSLVMFPLRDKTLVLSTEAQQFVEDFNKIILPNLSFSP